jgi:hypothetical protein
VTDQELFKNVVVAIVLQGRPSYDEQTKKCVYRHRDADGNVLKCAAGVLMPDDVYSPALETISASTLFSMAGLDEAERERKFTLDQELAIQDVNNWAEKNGWAKHVDLIQALQHAHDEAADVAAAEGFNFVDRFIDECERTAKQFGLQMPDVKSG